MLYCAVQRKPFIVSFCRCAPILSAPSIRETSCEVYDEASDGAFFGRSVLVGKLSSFYLGGALAGKT